MIKGVIFDFDGVLVHSEKANIEAAVKTFKDIGKPLTEEEEKLIPGRASLDFIPEFLRVRGDDSPDSHDHVYTINKENYTMIWKEVVVIFPLVQSTLKELISEGKVLGIATTNRKETIEMFFDNFGMREYFSYVITGEDVQKRKPDPEVYNLAVEKSGLSKEELLAVEDTSIGLSSAKRAGLRCVVIPNEYTAHENFSQADHIVESIQDILHIV